MKTLTAINLMLAAIAQAPVASYQSTHPYAIAARDVLERTNEEIQEQGWWFNQDYNVKFPVETDGTIKTGNSCLRLFDSLNRREFADRDGTLYDPIHHTGVFQHDLVLDVVSLLDFAVIPSVAQSCIAHKAAYTFFMDRDGELNKAKLLLQEASMAWNRLQSEAISQLGLSNADSPHYRAFTNRLCRTLHLPTYRYNRVPDRLNIWVR